MARVPVAASMVAALMEVARREGIPRVVGYILPENRGMQRICAKMGFRHAYSDVEAVLEF